MKYRLTSILALLFPKRLVILTCTLFFLFHSAFSQTTYTATSTAFGNWGTSTNWSPAGIPGVNDSVVIPNGKSIKVGSAALVKAVNIQSGGSLQLTSQLTVGDGTGAHGITIAGTLQLSSACIVVNGYWALNTGGTFSPGTTGNNKYVIMGSGGSIGGTMATTFTSLIINTTNASDKVTILKSPTINESLTLEKGILKMPFQTIEFTKTGILNGAGTSFTDIVTGSTVTCSGVLANSSDGAGDANNDGGTISNIGTSGTYSLTVNGAVTFYNAFFSKTGLSLDATAGVYSRINDTLYVGYSGSGNQFTVPAGNSPIWGSGSTLYIDGSGQWNYSNFSRLWNAASGSTIGTTPGYPNNVTIANNNNNCGSISQDIPINGLLTVGNGSSTTILTFSGGTNGNFSCGGVVITPGANVWFPNANVTVKGKFSVWTGGSFSTSVVGGSCANSGSTYTGTITMAGSGTCAAPDTIRMSSANGTFNNLTIANTAYTKLATPVTVRSTFTLSTSGSSGILETDATNILNITNTATTAISGGGTNNFINGPVNWSWPPNVTANTYIVPVGKITTPGCSGSAYLPFTITPKTPNSATTNIIEAFNTGSGGSGSTVNTLSSTEYWKLTTSSSLIAGSSVSLQRPTSISVGSVIAGSNGQSLSSNSSYSNLGGTVSGSTISTSSDIGTSSPFFFAISNPSPIVTLPATSITTTSATINGSFNTGGLAAAISFGWGTSSSGTSSISSIRNATGVYPSTTAIPDSAFLTGLTPNTLYTFKAKTSTVGNGTDLTFTTLPNAPVATTAGTSTTTSITANWTAPTGQGTETFTYTVQIATDAGFTTGITNLTNLSSATLTSIFTNLLPATTYYYRVKAVNVTGSSAWSNTIITSTLLAGTASCSSPSGTNAGVQYFNKTTTTGPAIDGTIDAIWSSASSNSITKVTVGGTSDINNVAGGTYWKSMWSADSLYLLVQVTDPGTLVYLPSTSTMQSGGGVPPGTATSIAPLNPDRSLWDIDGVELVINPNASTGTSYDGVDDNQLRFNLGASAISGQSAGGATQFVGTAFTRMATGTNTVFSMKTFMNGTAPGYVLEARMSWTALFGYTPTMADLQNFGFDISVNDNDNASGTRSTQTAWNATDGSAFSNPSQFGTATLVGCQTPPTVINPTATSITDVSASLGATVQSGGAGLDGIAITPVSIYGTAYNTTGSPVSSNVLANGGGPITPSAAYTGSRTGLNPQTHYYYIGYATNSKGVTGVSTTATFWTLSSPPTAQVSSFAASSASCTGVALSWNVATFPKNLSKATDSNYIILRRSDGTNPTTAGIVNGATVTQASITAAQSGTTLLTVLKGNIASYTDAVGTGTYNYLIIPYTWNGSEDSTRNYLIASAPAASTTLSAAPSGGTATADQTICSGSSPIALNVTGVGGTIDEWQYSSDNFVTDIHSIPSSAATSLSSGAMGSLTANRYYRVLSHGGACSIVYSSTVLITVNQQTTIYTALNTSSATLCNNGSQSTTLSQSSGVLSPGAYWQWYSDAGFTTPVGGHLTGAATLVVSPTITTTYYLRAEGIISPCANLLSDNTKAVTVTVNQPSILPTQLNSSAAICSGSSITLSQTGGSLGTGANWNWYTSNTIFNPSTRVSSTTLPADASVSVSPTSTTQYWLRIEGGVSGCGVASNTIVGSVTITVNTISVAPTALNKSAATICNAGVDNITLTQTGGSLGTGAYWQWYSDAGFTTTVGGHLSSSNASLNVSPSVNTTYYLRAEGGTSPCAAIVYDITKTVTVTIATRPTANVTSANRTSICNNPDTTAINGTITANGAWTLTFNDNSTITGSGSGTWSRTVNPTTTTTYSLKSLVDQSCQSQPTDLTSSATVVVIKPSKAPTSTGTSVNICNINGSYTGGVILTQTGGTLGAGAYWQWYNDKNYTQPFGPQLTSANAFWVDAPSTRTVYYLRAEGTSSPCTATVTPPDSVVANVNVQPVLPTSGNTLANGSTGPVFSCSSNALTLTKNTASGSLGSADHWQWYQGTSVATATAISGATSQASDAKFIMTSYTTFNSALVFFIKPEGGNLTGCPALTTFQTVSVLIDSPTATFNPSPLTTLCAGGSTAFAVKLTTSTSSSPGWYYKWSATNGTSGGLSTGSRTTSVTAPTVAISPTVTTTYTIDTLKDNQNCPASSGVLASLSRTITVNQPSSVTSSVLSANSSNPLSTCGSASVTLKQSGGTLGTGAKWKWYTSGTIFNTSTIVDSSIAADASITTTVGSTTTYYLRAEGGTAPCSTGNLLAATSVTVTVNTSSSPATSVSASVSNMCGSGSVTLTQTGGTLGSGAYWQWYTDPSFSVASKVGTTTTAGNASTTITATATKTYYVRAENTGSPCAATASDNTKSVTVTVTTPSVAAGSVNAAAATVCAGNSTTLKQTGGSLGTGAYWQWYSDASFTTKVGPTTTATDAATIITPAGTATYYVRAEGGTSPCAATASDNTKSVTVTVNTQSTPATSVSSSATALCSGSTITLTQTGGSLGTSAYWQWYSDASFTTKVGATTTASDASTTITPAGTTTYYVRAEGGTSPCTATASDNTKSVTVTVNTQSVAAGSVSATAATVCAGNSTTLKQTGGTLGTGAYWQWYSDASFTTKVGPTTTATDAATIITPAGTSTYYVRAEGATSPCAATASDNTKSVTVTVNTQSTPATSVSLSATAVCTGSAITLTQTGGTLGTNAYWQWYSDASFTTKVGATTTAGNASTTVTATATATYYVRAEGGASPCAATASDNTKSVTVTVTTYRKWLGTTSSNWNDASNWCGGVPDKTTDVLIPASSFTGEIPYYPVLSSGYGSVKNITIATFAGFSAAPSVTVNGSGQLSVSGTITNNSIFNLTSGTLQMNGSSAQTLSGSTFVGKTIKNLIDSNTALSLASTANDTLNISGAFSFGNIDNATFNTHDNLTMLSRDSANGGTARIADLTNAGANSGNAISGEVVVERFVRSRRAWRLVTAPLETTSQTINDSWQEGVTNVNRYAPVNPHPGYGTEITNTLTTSSATGYDDAATNNPSIKYLSGTWTTIPQTNTSLINSQPGYMLFIRGDRSVVVTTPPFNPSTTTILRAKGTLKQNQIQFTAPGTSFQMVGNPYASELNLDSLFRKYPTIVGSNYYVWDPMMTGSESVGAFVAFSYNGTPGIYASTPHVSSFGDGKIESGQAFIINFGTTDPVSFFENNKATQTALVFRPVNPIAQSFTVRLNAIESDGSSSLDDGAVVLYDKKYADTLNWLEDARKITNPNENISIYSFKKSVAIEKRSGIKASDTIYLNLTALTQNTQYSIDLRASDLAKEGLKATLEDKFLQTSTPVSLADGDVTTVKFTVTANAASQGAGRFRIVFAAIDNSDPLPVTFVNIKAIKQEQNIAVQWKVNNQLNIKQYDVERSTDGIHFVKVATVFSINGTVIDYKWIDANASDGNNYYRIRSVGIDNTFQYSTIVVVTFTNDLPPAIAVYPNPVQNGIINLQMTNMLTGKYKIRLLDNIGQVMQVNELAHDVINTKETIRFDGRMAKGIYHLEVNGPNGYRSEVKVVY
ncbi:sugar-binding protein [Ferruginibacter albus]|uniref:sugar-binding protein n=1 Tax=Ferruginibacter albus TaxID=2875540 RepID=UPI001CC535E8|nr:sugar-binding protein [Ferruginibacter albus]UAY51207.1 fibronectin type III domain-containing protein [Ferruginibacter albus]